MDKSSKIYIAGHNGMVGSAIRRKLMDRGYQNLICKDGRELDLREQDQVRTFFKEESPEYVFLAAAKVGGIHANNTYRAEFIYDNIMIQSNVIHAAFEGKVQKLLFLGSSCIFPKFAPQPLKEEHLLSGFLEPTNEPYAIAKISGIKMCQAYRAQHECNFISALPTNLYGPNDNYDPENSHVLPALIRKFHDAVINHKNEVALWGSGSPKREFLHVDDLADACVFLMENYNDEEPVNVGSGEEITIKELADMIKEVAHFEGKIVYDPTKPDGTPRKLLDSSRISQMGWQNKIDLKEGVKSTFENYTSQLERN